MRNTFISQLNLTDPSHLGLEDSFKAFNNTISNYDPNSSNAYLQLGHSLYSKNHPEAAVTAYNKAIALESQHAVLVNHLGDALLDLGQYKGAAEAYRTTISLNPKFVQAHANLALSLYLQSQIKEVLEANKKALLLDPESGPAHFNLSLILKKQNKIKEAKNAFKIATRHLTATENIHYEIEVNSSNENKVHAPGQTNGMVFKESLVHKIMRRTRGCFFFCKRRKALKSAPPTAPDEKQLFKRIKLAQARFLTAARDDFLNTLALSDSDHVILKDAFKTFSDTLELNANDSEAYLHLGISLDDKCFPEAAVIAYTKALSLTPQHAVIFNYLGEALFEISRYEEAIDAYRKAIALDSAYIDAYTKPGFGLILLFQDTRGVRGESDGSKTQ